jgi:glycosyltransferase involved in cell wall biosynthesis
MKNRAICTIISRNYLAHARTLAHSFRELHPDARIFVCLVDRNEGAIDPAQEPFELIEAEALGIRDFAAMAFQYDVTELNTAVKPFVLEHLLCERGVEQILYLDPDILVLSPLTWLFDQLDRASILLTPHATHPYRDAKLPNENLLLQTGAYNLGFIGVAATEQGRAMLRWWQGHCYDECAVRPEAGLFVDQKWVDLVPSFFSETEILRDPGLNVAYWNLHERQVDSLTPPRCNGEPLYFFHFSGFKTDAIDAISRHQNRFRLEQRPDLRDLFALYAAQLERNGLAECAKLPYAYGAFDDGRRIDPVMRRLYHSLARDDRRRFGEPFVTGGANSFSAWMRQPATVTRNHKPKGARREWLRLKSLALRAFARWLRDDAYIDNLMYFLHQTQVRVMTRFPDPFGGDRGAFLHWFRRHREELYDAGAQARVLTSISLSPGPPATDLPPSLVRRRTSAEPGVNVLGYFTTESGVAEAARGVSRAIETAGIPVVRNNLDSGPELRHGDTTYSDFSPDNPHAINIVHTNADMLRATRREVGKAYFRGRFNIGYWLWELPEFPDHWSGRFRYLDEVWTPSSFCVESIAAKSSVPVVRVPIPLDPSIAAPLSRTHFALPDDVFLFFFAFDFMSYFERKNPIAVIEAFRLAFRDTDRALLLIKSSNGSRFPEQLQQMKDAADKQRVRLFDGYLERNELRNLLRLSDCYVSLHRSEGFGLSIAEAMSFAKPVIATAYSANLDYMTADNGLLVRHRLVEIEEDIGPYARGQVWADPDIEHAASHMRRVYEDADFAASIGRRAQHDVQRDLSDDRVGDRIQRRLALLR